MNENTGSILQYPCDTVILREGEISADMYQIIKGHAEIYTGYKTDDEVLIGIIGPQACFGELGLLLQRPAIYTVVAYSDLVLLRVSESSMGSFVRDNYRKTIEIMQNMAKTMVVMQQQISLLAKELEKEKKTNPITIHKARRNLRAYALYNSSLFYHPFDMDNLRDSL